MTFRLIPPGIPPPLDENFRPAILANQAFRQKATSPLILGLERNSGEVSTLETKIYSSDHPDFEDSFQYVERIVKFLLWQRGGHTLYVGNSPRVAEQAARPFRPTSSP